MFSCGWKYLLLSAGLCKFILHTHVWVRCRGQLDICIQLSGVSKGHIHIFMHSLCIKTRQFQTGWCMMNSDSISHIFKLHRHIQTNVRCFSLFILGTLRLSTRFSQQTAKANTLNTYKSCHACEWMCECIYESVCFCVIKWHRSISPIPQWEIN